MDYAEKLDMMDDDCDIQGFYIEKDRIIKESEIDSLQRYRETRYETIGGYYTEEDDKGEYVRYDDLIDLLK